MHIFIIEGVGGGWKRFKFSTWEVCRWPYSRIISLKFAPCLQVPRENSQMSARRKRARKRAVGNSICWKFASSQKGRVSYLSSSAFIYPEELCPLWFAYLLKKQFHLEVDWGLGSGLRTGKRCWHAFYSHFVGVLYTELVGCGAGQKMCILLKTPLLSCYLILSLQYCCIWPRTISAFLSPCDTLTYLHSPGCWLLIFFWLFEAHFHKEWGLFLLCPSLVDVNGLTFGALNFYCIPDALLNSPYATYYATGWME